jgi:hypothetical protein
MQARHQRQGIDLQGWFLLSLCSMVCWWGNRCLVFNDHCNHDILLLGEGTSLAKDSLASSANGF